MYGRKFEKELLALRKEFEAQQQELSKYAMPPGHTPPTQASIVASGPGGESMSRVASLDALGEARGEEEEGQEEEGQEEEEGFGAVHKPV